MLSSERSSEITQDISNWVKRYSADTHLVTLRCNKVQCRHQRTSQITQVICNWVKGCSADTCFALSVMSLCQGLNPGSHGAGQSLWWVKRCSADTYLSLSTAQFQVCAVAGDDLILGMATPLTVKEAACPLLGRPSPAPLDPGSGNTEMTWSTKRP